MSMTSFTRHALIVALTIALGASVHAADRLVPPSVPSDLVVDETFQVFFVAHAIGTQNYICAPAATLSGVDWFFIGPQATGFDDDGKQVLTHFQSKNPLR